MKWINRGISVIFHPIFMPVLALLFFFKITPRFVPVHLVNAKLISLSILSIILPILVFFLLKTVGKTDSIHLKTTKERLRPLLINCLIVGLIIIRVFPQEEVIELYYFFVGALISNITCLLFALGRFKASIHMIATCGVFVFLIALALHYNININGAIALMAIIIGAVASSRLYLKAHTYRELAIGLLIGVIPQLILLKYWL